jgi:hypothetical protein
MSQHILIQVFFCNWLLVDLKFVPWKSVDISLHKGVKQDFIAQKPSANLQIFRES